MTRQFAKDQPAGFKNGLQKIAVVGAGGTAGGWIVEELLKNKNITLTAITREDSNNEIPAGLTVLKVNYGDQEALVNAMKGQDCVVVTMGVRAAPKTTEKLYRAAASAGVPWLVPNEYGSDDRTAESTSMGKQKKAERDLIEELGVSSWIGIASMFWYEFSLSGKKERFGFDFVNKELVWFDDGSRRINVSTFPQVGRGVAAVLGLKIFPEDENDHSTCLDDYRNKFVRISSFYVNQKDMFDSVLRVTGDKASDWKQSSRKPEDLFAEGQERIQKGDMFGAAQMMYARVFYPDNIGDMSNELDNDRLGLPKESLDEFTNTAIDMASDKFHEKRYAAAK